MTKEDLEVLKKYDDVFTSLKNGATHILPTLMMRKECSTVYYNEKGRMISMSEWSCSRCAFKIYKELSEMYFKELEKYKVVKEPEPNVENKEVADCTVSNKKKRSKKV